MRSRPQSMNLGRKDPLVQLFQRLIASPPTVVLPECPLAPSSLGWAGG